MPLSLCCAHSHADRPDRTGSKGPRLECVLAKLRVEVSERGQRLLGWLMVLERKVEPADDQEKHDLHLVHCESLAHAGPETPLKGAVGIPIDGRAVLQESLGLEHLGLVKVLGVVVHDLRSNADIALDRVDFPVRCDGGPAKNETAD